MFTPLEKPTVYFDVDSTLVFTEQEAPPLRQPRIVIIGGRAFTVHEPHVEAIKDFAARGHNVIVWSQGGADWAQSVVHALYLNDLVTACLPKPYWYFDDKRSEFWMTENARSYIEPK